MYSELTQPILASNRANNNDIIQAINVNGQTFVTRPDLAQSVSGQTMRYQLLRSSAGPITQANRGSATIIQQYMANNSGQLIGGDYTVNGGKTYSKAMRIDTTNQMTKIPNATNQLAYWTALGVYTCKTNQAAWYAIVETTTSETVQAGINSMTVPVIENTASAISPYLQIDGGSRTPAAPSNNPTTTGLGAEIHLIASQPNGGAAYENILGDYWAISGDTTMGWQDGVQFVTDVYKSPASSPAPAFNLYSPRETVWHPDYGTSYDPNGVDTNYIGLGMKNPATDPANGNSRYYRIGYFKLLWLLNQLTTTGQTFHDRYLPNQNNIWTEGDCMGGLGGMLLGMHNPTKLACIHAPLPCWDYSAQVLSTSWKMINYSNSASTIYAVGPTSNPMGTDPTLILMDDNTTTFKNFVNTIGLMSAATDLPVVLACNAKHDGIYTWPTCVTAVNTLLSTNNFVAYGWNSYGHDNNGMVPVDAHYAKYNFPRNVSIPCFANSAFDDNLGTGTATAGEYDGDLVGCMGMGWRWSGVGLGGSITDTPTAWSAVIDNNWMGNNATTIPTTSLQTAILSSTTPPITVTVTSTTGFTSTPANQCRIGTEYFLISNVNAGASTLTFSSRGINSVAAAHNINDTITMMPLVPTGPNGGPFSAGRADVTIRRRQQFKPAIGATVSWTATFSGGGSESGTVTVDSNANITIPQVLFNNGQTTTLALS